MSSSRIAIVSIRSVKLFVCLATMVSEGSVTYGGNWTMRGPDIVGVDLYGVTHTPNGFFGVGPAGTIAKSLAGRDWFVDHLNPGDWLIGVGYGGGRFVSVGWNYEPATTWPVP